MGKKVTTEIFLERAKQAHGDKYDYSKTQYVSYYTKVCIICPEHGEFWQYPSDHTKGCGCPKCGKERGANLHRLTTEEFIRKAKLVHGCFYDYSKVVYKSAKDKITIICPIHGEFEQTPNTHLSGRGCPKCGKIIAINKTTKTLSEFLSQAHEVHGNTYDYSNVEYKNNRTPIKIICKKHGEFNQTPYKHLSGHGCPKCNQSKGEEKIELFLNNKNISFISQYMIKCPNTIRPSGKCFIDFYIPDFNLFIEYNGIQHYIPVEQFGGKIKFEEQQIRDSYVRQYCKENNINLFEIKYDQNVDEILSNIFNGQLTGC